MNLQEIQVNINADGKVAISLQGIKGDACLALTKELEELLGNQVEERKFKHEYFEAPPEQQQIRHRKTRK